MARKRFENGTVIEIEGEEYTIRNFEPELDRYRLHPEKYITSIDIVDCKIIMTQEEREEILREMDKW